MTFTGKTTGGVNTVLDNGDRVVSIGTRATNVFINEILPIGEGMTEKRRILFPVDIQLQKFTGISPVAPYPPTFGSVLTFKGQSEPEKVQELDKETGPNVRHALEKIVFDEAIPSCVYGSFRAKCLDEFDGELYANQFTVAGFTVTNVGGDEDTGAPPVSTPSAPFPLTPFMLSLTEQYDMDSPQRTKRGDAKMRIRRSEVSKAQLESFAYISVTIPGGEVIKYTLWDREVEIEQTQQFCVYLRRLQ